MRKSKKKTNKKKNQDMIYHLAEFDKKLLCSSTVTIGGNRKIFQVKIQRVDIYYLGQAFCLLSSMETSSLSGEAGPVMVKDVDIFDVM